MRIAYLACRDTMPGSPTRRVDAFEHDEMMAHLEPAFAAGGSEIIAISWDDADADWSQFDAALIGTTWDYQDRLEEFIARLGEIETHIPVFNDAATVRWNARKTYLAQLQERGAPVIPSLWYDHVGQVELDATFAHFSDSDKLVFKRQVGANAEGQHILNRGDALPDMPEAMFVQPFRPAIQEEGELGFIFVDGELSHATQKQAKPGDYRVQSGYGGFDITFTPDARDLETAQAIIGFVDPTPLYARVDLVRGPEGTLELMEMELIEPFLYVDKGPNLGSMLHTAIAKRLSN
jgi:hypothetical protein